jgi:hypothetical protein
MELFAMGPRSRRDDGAINDASAVSLEPIELSAGATDVAAAPADDEPETGHWWAELIRADVLAVTATATVAISVLGLPFAQFLTNIYFLPVQLSTAWVFLPILLTAGVATAFGLLAVLQAARHGAATWVRVLGGAATLLGFLLFLGTGLIWYYVVETDFFGRLGQYF